MHFDVLAQTKTTYTLTACYAAEWMLLYIFTSKAEVVCKQLHTEIIQSWTEYWSISPDENEIMFLKIL